MNAVSRGRSVASDSLCCQGTCMYSTVSCFVSAIGDSQPLSGFLISFATLMTTSNDLTCRAVGSEYRYRFDCIGTGPFGYTLMLFSSLNIGSDGRLTSPRLSCGFGGDLNAVRGVLGADDMFMLPIDSDSAFMFLFFSTDMDVYSICVRNWNYLRELLDSVSSSRRNRAARLSLVRVSRPLLISCNPVHNSVSEVHRVSLFSEIASLTTTSSGRSTSPGSLNLASAARNVEWSRCSNC